MGDAVGECDGVTVGRGDGAVVGVVGVVGAGVGDGVVLVWFVLLEMRMVLKLVLVSE